MQPDVHANPHTLTCTQVVPVTMPVYEPPVVYEAPAYETYYVPPPRFELMTPPPEILHERPPRHKRKRSPI